MGTTPRTLVALGTGLVLGCATRSAPATDPIPPWLREHIAEFERQPVANPPLWIARYRYRDQVVYYVPARCCDIPSTLYNAEGRILCNPDGGFSGMGDGRCPDFASAREDEVVLWRDPRPPS